MLGGLDLRSIAALIRKEGPWVPLAIRDAANSATIDFLRGIGDGRFDNYAILISDLVPTTDNTTLRAQLSVDGATFVTGAGSYNWHYSSLRAVTGGTGNNASDSKIDLCAQCGNAAGETLSGVIELSLSQQSRRHLVYFNLRQYDSTPEPARTEGGGMPIATTMVRGIRFLMSAGNISTGRFALYGLRRPHLRV